MENINFPRRPEAFRLAGLAAAFLSITSVFALAEPEPVPLTIEGIINQTVARNPDLHRAAVALIDLPPDNADPM